MGCEKTKDIHAPFRALSLFLGFIFPSTLCSLEFHPSACVLPFFSSRRGFSSLSAAAPVSFFLPGWLPRSGAAKTRKERERNWTASLISRSLVLSFLLRRSRALLLTVVAAARWFVNAKFKLSHAIHPATPMKVPTHPLFPNPPPSSPLPSLFLPRDVPPQTPKRAYQ